MKAVTVAFPVQQPPDDHFRLCIPAANSGHIQVSLLRC